LLITKIDAPTSRFELSDILLFGRLPQFSLKHRLASAMSCLATFDFVILEARGLPRPTPSAHQVPSCLLEIPGVESVQTAGVKESENPSWREQFHFENVSLTSPSIHYALTIKAKTRQQSRVIASAERDQPLTSTEPGTQFETWVPLTSGAQDCGQVHVRISLIEFTQIEQAPASEATPAADDAPAVEAKDTEPTQGLTEEQERPSPRTIARSLYHPDPTSPRTKEMEKLDRMKLQILNDDGDPAELEQESRQYAKRQYEAWLRQLPQAARLLANTQEVATRGKTTQVQEKVAASESST
jgi:hypothetical protein